VAKKARTPAPPRPVQAPKRRTDSGKGATDDRRKLLYLAIFAASGIVALAVVLAFFLTRGGSTSGNGGGSLDGPSVPTDLPGLRSTKAPWDAGYDGLPDRLKPLGLNALSAEGVTVHIHQHLDIFVDGKKINIPPNIGIYDNEFIVELHVHQGDPGIIHVESPTKRDYSLGQFLGVWGVRATKNCLGGYCATASKPLKVYVNGKLVKGDWPRLVLKSHQQIAIVYGKPPAHIPKTWRFKPGE
jgi:hypothetical protein